MSAATQRLPLAEAEAVAAELVELLEPACLRIEVAGSIRRRVPTIGDVDILAIARVAPVLDMFDQPIGQVDVLSALLDELCGQQVIRQWRGSKGQPCWGKSLKRGIFRGLDVQIQSVPAEAWGMWLIVRTGPSAFSHALVTPRGREFRIKRRDGSIEYRSGQLPPGFEVRRGSGFQLYRYGGRVETREEIDVFRALGLPYVAPEARL